MCRNLIALCSLVFIVACKNNSIDNATALTGRWIETTGRGDTLTFNANNSQLMKIDRGFQNYNGVRLPKAGGGLWEYRLLKDYKMEVRSMLSSSLAYTTSHVELKNDILYVSNFYESENKSLELRSFSLK